MGISSWAYPLLGILLGIIYFVDGWRSAPSDQTSIVRSPKVRGLTYLLGGGIAPTVDALLSPGQTSNLPAYIIAFTITTLLCLLFLVVYALAVSYRAIRQVFPHQNTRETLVDSLPYSFVALQQGIPRFNHEVSNLRIGQVTEQRNFSIDFLLGFYGSLIAKHHVEDNVREFLDFADRCLQAFLLNYLEGGRVLEDYRASVYFYDETNENLRYLTGVSPETAPHSKQPLPAEGSLAAWARNNPLKPHEDSSEDRNSDVPFFRREAGHRYNSVISCAIQHVAEEGGDPDMVLSIDSVESSIPDLSGYVGRMTLAVSSLLSHAQLSMDVTTEAYRIGWIKNKRSPVMNAHRILKSSVQSA